MLLKSIRRFSWRLSFRDVQNQPREEPTTVASELVGAARQAKVDGFQDLPASETTTREKDVNVVQLRATPRF